MRRPCIHYTPHNAHATHGPRTRHAHATHTPLIRHACIVHTHHAHATEGKLYTDAEFVEEYNDEAGAVWARAGCGVDAARNTPKKPKLGAAGADGAASGGSARAGAVRGARSPAPAPAPTCAAYAYASASASASASTGGDGDSGGGGGGGLDKLEGKLMNHLGRLRHYLGKLKGLDATRAQDCFAASNTRAAASSGSHASVVGARGGG